MSRKGENIYKRKDGRWEDRYIKGYTENRKIKYGYVYARTYKDVKKKLIEKKHYNITSQPKDIESSDIVFSQIANKWLASLTEIKLSTYNKYANTLDTYIYPDIGDCHISDVTQDKLSCLISHLQEHESKRTRRKLSSKTIRHILSILHRIGVYAEKRNYHVFYDTELFSFKQNSQELSIFSKDQTNLLISFLIENMNAKNLGILICLYTGLRVGEICALKWKNISLDEKSLYVEQTMQRVQVQNATAEDCPKTKIIIDKPKTACSIRTIPIPGSLIPLLKKYQKSPDSFVLSERSEKYIEPRSLQYHYKSLLARAKIPYHNYHALRHTFATRCVEAGFDIKSLSEILGHSSVNITLNRYVHPSMDLKRQNMEKLNNLFAVK